jgi:hypothetical protein
VQDLRSYHIDAVKVFRKGDGKRKQAEGESLLAFENFRYFMMVGCLLENKLSGENLEDRMD